MKIKKWVLVVLISIYVVGFIGERIANQMFKTYATTTYLLNKDTKINTTLGMPESQRIMLKFSIYFGTFFNLFAVIAFGFLLFFEAKNNKKPILIWTLLGCMFQMFGLVLFYVFNQYYEKKKKYSEK